jgi:hypothetical protein
MRQVDYFDRHNQILFDLPAFFLQPSRESRFAAQAVRLTVTAISYKPGTESSNPS